MNDSFNLDNLKKKIKINNSPIRKYIRDASKINKYTRFNKNFANHEREYNEDINKILDKISHQRSKSETKKEQRSEQIRPKIQISTQPKKQNKLLPPRFPSESDSNTLEKVKIEAEDFYFKLQTYAYSSLVQKLHFSNKPNKNFRKLKTAYKYISDDDYNVKFHYYREEEINKSIESEYKFFKLKEEAMAMINVFESILNLFNDHLKQYEDYVNRKLIPSSNLFGEIKEILIETTEKFLKLLNFYQNELNEFCKKYLKSTEGLLIDNKSFVNQMNSSGKIV